MVILLNRIFPLPYWGEGEEKSKVERAETELIIQRRTTSFLKSNPEVNGMPKLEFRDLLFEDMDRHVKVNFLRLFYFYLDKDDLKKIADFKVLKKAIDFTGISEQSAGRKFNKLLLKGFNDLKSRLTQKQAIYVHRNSGMPLIGSIDFGIIDRNTNIIEVRPITGCNLGCIYCSVDQARRQVDFVVEMEYIIEEIKRLVDFKDDNDIEIHIGSQGEPLLYENLAGLVRGLSRIKQVKRISIDTNATLLSKKLVDELVDAGMTQFNVSINSLDKKLAQKIAGAAYNLDKVIEICRYIAKKADLVIAPVWLQGINDDEMPKFIRLVKEMQNKHRIILGIQNFLEYRYGKKPVKQMSWDLFRKKLESLEKKHNTRLVLDFKKDFKVHETRHLPKLFKKGQILKARVVCPGHLKEEMLAVAKDRIVSVMNCSARPGQDIKLRIIRTKHNIYVAKQV